MKGQYVIIDLRNMDFMKDKDGVINIMTPDKKLLKLVECMSLKMLG